MCFLWLGLYFKISHKHWRFLKVIFIKCNNINLNISHIATVIIPGRPKWEMKIPIWSPFIKKRPHPNIFITKFAEIKHEYCNFKFVYTDGSKKVNWVCSAATMGRGSWQNVHQMKLPFSPLNFEPFYWPSNIEIDQSIKNLLFALIHYPPSKQSKVHNWTVVWFWKSNITKHTVQGHFLR